jgi:hypothetical protein
MEQTSEDERENERKENLLVEETSVQEDGEGYQYERG